MHWLSKQDLNDSEILVIRVAAAVLFAGSAFMIDELFSWHLGLLLLIGFTLLAALIGLLVAKISPMLIKVIPVIIVIALTMVAAKDLFQHFYFKIVYIEPFLEQTDNCKALGLQLVNKENLAVCVAEDSKTIQQGCQYIVDNEWRCSSVLWSDVLAEPKKQIKASNL